MGGRIATMNKSEKEQSHLCTSVFKDGNREIAKNQYTAKWLEFIEKSERAHQT